MDNIILTLICLPNVGKKTVINLVESMIDKPKDEKELLELFIESKLINKRIKIPTSDDVKFASEKSELLLLNSQKQNIKYIDILNEKFPKRLTNLKDKPVALFYKGNYDCLLKEKSVAIIGSRKASEEGLKYSYKLGYDFGVENYVVVSGLAIGCDKQVHKGCLKAKGKTLAVLPCGLDNLYPKCNDYLAQTIIDNKGCLVSEYPIGTKPFRNNFIERDKIISGISSAVIACESEINSGTMKTIMFAKNQGKVISCLDINVSGNKKIIQEKNCIVIDKELKTERLKEEIVKFNKNCIINKTRLKYKQLNIREYIN